MRQRTLTVTAIAAALALPLTGAAALPAALPDCSTPVTSVVATKTYADPSLGAPIVEHLHAGTDLCATDTSLVGVNGHEFTPVFDGFVPSLSVQATPCVDVNAFWDYVIVPDPESKFGWWIGELGDGPEGIFSLPNAKSSKIGELSPGDFYATDLNVTQVGNAGLIGDMEMPITFGNGVGWILSSKVLPLPADDAPLTTITLPAGGDVYPTPLATDHPTRHVAPGTQIRASDGVHGWHWVEDVWLREAAAPTEEEEGASDESRLESAPQYREVELTGEPGATVLFWEKLFPMQHELGGFTFDEDGRGPIIRVGRDSGVAGQLGYIPFELVATRDTAVGVYSGDRAWIKESDLTGVTFADWFGDKAGAARDTLTGNDSESEPGFWETFTQTPALFAALVLAAVGAVLALLGLGRAPSRLTPLALVRRAAVPLAAVALTVSAVIAPTIQPVWLPIVTIAAGVVAAYATALLVARVRGGELNVDVAGVNAPKSIALLAAGVVAPLVILAALSAGAVAAYVVAGLVGLGVAAGWVLHDTEVSDDGSIS